MNFRGRRAQMRIDYSGLHGAWPLGDHTDANSEYPKIRIIEVAERKENPQRLLLRLNTSR